VLLVRQQGELARMLDLGAGTLLATLLLVGLAHAQRTVEMTYLVRRLGVTESFREGFLLTGAGFLLNYLPFNAGFFARGVALKRHRALDYTAYASLTLMSGIVHFATAALVFAMALLLAESPRTGNAWLAAACALFGCLSLALPMLPRARARTGDSRVERITARLADAAVKLRGRGRGVFLLVVFATLKLGLIAARLGLCLQAFQVSPSAAALLAFAAAITALSVVNLTPGNLGLRELAVSVLGASFGIAPAVGLAAASLDRAVTLAYTLAVGIPGVITLRERLDRSGRALSSSGPSP
jgi:uncharacterized membrane protein YbhN (UPF0104 family)